MEHLVAASQHGRIGAVKRVLNDGVNINALHRVSGRTALMECAKNGHVEVAKILISNGANVDAKSSIGGRTALMNACENGRLEMVELLLNNLAEINHQDRFGKTALMLAAKAGHRDLVELLIQDGANLEVRDCWLKSALESAAGAGHHDVVKLLANHGAGSQRWREQPVSAVDAWELDAYYAVLQCEKSASTDDIKRKYRRIVKEFHPDAIKGKGLHEDFVRFANKRFQDIEEAYRKIMRFRGLQGS